MRRSFGFVLVLASVVGCHPQPNPTLMRIVEARRLAADLRVQFHKASEASDRAVLANTDEASVASAREAEQTKKWIGTDVEQLDARLRDLGSAGAIDALAEFNRRFAAYEKVDHEVLALAVENTNLKAQRLSFGPAREAADAFRAALKAAAKSAPAKDRARADALVAEAIIAVREIQVLQAPHIAESDDIVMTRFEGEMAALERAARDALAALAPLGGGEDLARATTALDKFSATSKELVKLSRRNSNVRSLELVLRAKPPVTTSCDESLGTLQDALAKDTFTGTR